MPSHARTPRLVGIAGAAALALSALAPAAAHAQSLGALGDSAGSASGGSSGGGTLVDQVVAVVGDAVVLRSELLMRVAPMTADLQNISDPDERQRRRTKIRSQALDKMIDEELIVQAAEESKVSVSEDEVDKAVEEIKTQNDLSDSELVDALAQQGYTMKGYRQDLRRQIMRMRAINMLVRPKVSVTDEDVRARYDEMTRRSTSVSEVRLKHILVELPKGSGDAELEAAKERASQLIQKARSGAPFEDLAREHSDDEATRGDGGDLGWIERGSIATEWEEIVFAMDEGEVRGPINGPEGLHVFYVADVKKNEIGSFEKVKGKIRNELYREQIDRKTEKWLEDLRQKSHIDIRCCTDS